MRADNIILKYMKGLAFMNDNNGTVTYELASLYEKQLFWTRVCAALLALILVLCLAVGSIMDYRIKKMSSRLSQSLEALDSLTENLDKISGDLTEIDWTAAAVSLEKVSSELADVDWATLTDDLSKTSEAAQESMQKAMEAIDALDIETLNEAIADLKDVIEPLADLTNAFS